MEPMLDITGNIIVTVTVTVVMLLNMNIKQCTKETLKYISDTLHNEEVSAPNTVLLEYINQG